MKYLLTLLIFVSLLDAKTYRKSFINVVIDNTKNLMWVDDKTSVMLYLTHEEAILYCENLKHAGYKNWRVPHLIELETIVDKSNERTYINRSFKFNLPDGYWAYKSHWRTLWFYADYMHFVSGTGYYDSRHKKKNIRCIRTIE
jgi:hypothetical protein